MFTGRFREVPAARAAGVLRVRRRLDRGRRAVEQRRDLKICGPPLSVRIRGPALRYAAVQTCRFDHSIA